MSLPHYTTTYHHTTYPSISPLLPSLSCKDRTVLITGAGTGIGPHLAQAFALAGCTRLALLGRTLSTLLVTKKSIETAFPECRVLTFVADITDSEAVGAAFTEAKKGFGSLGANVLVMNAAYLPDAEPVRDASIDEYMRGFDVNVKGPLILTQAFLRSLNTDTETNKSEVREPVIINLATAGSHLPPLVPGVSSYAASKLASLKMMEYVAFENPGVRVMNLHPGSIDTEMNRKSVRAGLSLEFDDASLPAHFIVWATSPEAAFLRNKVLWANWDVDELKAKAKAGELAFAGDGQLTVGLLGWP